MRKFILCALATVACLCGSAATSTIASREWVLNKLAEAGIKVSRAVITRNQDGSVTAVSPYTCAEVANMVAVKFTAFPAVFKPRPVIQVRRSFIMQLLVPTAYADGDNGNAISITVGSGSWIDANGNEHPFDFGDGLPLTLDDEMPEVPDDTHECEPDASNNCICKWYDKEVTDADCPDEYQDWTASEWVNAVGDIDAWVDNEPGITEKVTKKGTSYWVTDNQGVEVNLDNMTKSDAWAAALSDGLNTLNNRMKECREAWKKSKTCYNSEEQHDWYTENKSCGSNTWKEKTCRRNSGHKETEGVGQHDTVSKAWVNNGQNHKRTCSCGQKSETAAHDERHGNKQWNKDRTGWTCTDTCSSNCGWSRTTNHTCVHVKCAACSGGDGCSEPCKCNGEHDYKFKGTGKCKRCQCDGCKQTEYELYGTRTRADHTGWEACGYLEDNVNMRSSGDHCCCECGDWSHEAGSPHDRGNVPAYREQVADDEGLDPETEHWLVKKTRCRYCDDPYGEVEAHQFDDDSPVTYEYINNETHQKKQGCKLNCGYKKNGGDPIGHEKGDDSRWEYVSDEICREWSTCPADGGCGKIWSDDSGTHVRSENPDDKCKCGQCKTYQFEHEYSEDACGNSSCQYCGEIEPGTPENHKGWSDNGDGTHTCTCTKKTGDHCDWSEWSVESEDETTITWVRTCGKCPAKEHKTLPKDEPPDNCTLEAHVPLSDACGCICGYYTPGAEVTLTNSDRTVGEASEEEKFHHFGGSEDDQNCTCDCEYKHKFKEGCACPKICNKCKAKTEDGGEPTENDHEPAEHSCGCKCGSLDSSASSVKFHPKCPTSCRCYGANGDGTGQWHYPCGGYYGCERICSYSTTEEYHLANLGSDPVKENSIAAVETNHTKKGDGCGCRCRAYTPSNMTETSPLHTKKSMDCGCICGNAAESCFLDFHYWVPGNCYCECKGTSHDAKKKHQKVACECSNVCNGSNHGSGLANGIPYKTDSAYKTKHDPKGDGCGCKCGQFSGSDYPYATLPRFHNGHGTPDCMCEGSHGHKNFTASSACPKVCEICGYNKDRTKNDSSIHEFDEKCVCECGKFTRGHSWPEYTKTAIRTYECSICGNTIKDYRCYRKCNRRKCTAEEDYTQSEGHDPNCSEHSDPSHVYCYCECVDCLCDACSDYRKGNGGGTCSTCGKRCGPTSSGGGGGSGGESGGSGGLGDI